MAGIYILIPGSYKISRSVAVKANTDAVYRLLMKEEQWAKWWPANTAQINGKEAFYIKTNFTSGQKIILCFFGTDNR